MAYVSGLVTLAQRDELVRRGWEVEATPSELQPPEVAEGSIMVTFWVDSVLFDIMSGPDWDTSHGAANENLFGAE